MYVYSSCHENNDQKHQIVYAAFMHCEARHKLPLPHLARILNKTGS